MSKMEAYRKSEKLKKALVILMTGITSAIALNMFLTPAKVFSAGMNGVSQLLSSILETTFNIHISTGIFILILNVPIAILGWVKIGKSSTILSFVNVVSVTLFTLIIPVHSISTNPLMNAIIGGVLVGIGIGFSLKYGFTTGGTDIISLILSKTTGRTVGSLLFTINLVVIFLAGLLFNWESALYTIISIYCMTQVTDMIHTSNQKITAMIITQEPQSVMSSIQKRLVRGMTLIPAKGARSKVQGEMILIVITRYEVYDLEQAIYEIDQNAFVNIMPTQTVLGKFWNEEEQKVIKKTWDKIEKKENE
ncbi:YitT family protein [Vagococcus entomophilus]|uniref:DUF2179 domain-containing protein n=1 Tax=Vagococcus entomophilus TaxID=1160095 RepID=A0A430AJ15_9ENTE|nr:YitT family protein [Vagococcus entomophilus]RSU08081.1 hypothetical protein CBF30_02220 [Vagococcus entomophilus]